MKTKIKTYQHMSFRPRAEQERSNPIVKAFFLGIASAFGLAMTSWKIARADANETFNVKDYLLIEGSQTFLEGGAIQFLNKIINILSQFVGVLSILVLVISGLIMITSGANENALAKGKDGFKYAIIGTIISFSAYLITTFVQAVFYA